MPESYSERNEFKELIKSGMRTADEENFEEAIANVWRLASPSTVSVFTAGQTLRVKSLIFENL